MISGLQAVIMPLIAMVEARLTLAASMAIRRAVLMIAATMFGLGAFLFLSIGVFFGLMPGLGPAGAALILALIWALLAGLCYVLSLVRPRRVVAPPVAPPVAPASGAASGAVHGAAPVAVPPRHRWAARVSGAAPLLAIAALLAGIVAGRR